WDLGFGVWDLLLLQLTRIPGRGILDQLAALHEPLGESNDAEAEDPVTDDFPLMSRRGRGRRRRSLLRTAFANRHPSRHIFKRLGRANRALHRVVDFFAVNTQSSDAQLHGALLRGYLSFACHFGGRCGRSGVDPSDRHPVPARPASRAGMRYTPISAKRSARWLWAEASPFVARRRTRTARGCGVDTEPWAQDAYRRQQHMRSRPFHGLARACSVFRVGETASLTTAVSSGVANVRAADRALIGRRVIGKAPISAHVEVAVLLTEKGVKAFVVGSGEVEEREETPVAAGGLRQAVVNQRGDVAPGQLTMLERLIHDGPEILTGLELFPELRR